MDGWALKLRSQRAGRAALLVLCAVGPSNESWAVDAAAACSDRHLEVGDVLAMGCGLLSDEKDEGDG